MDSNLKKKYNELLAYINELNSNKDKIPKNIYDLIGELQSYNLELEMENEELHNVLEKLNNKTSEHVKLDLRENNTRFREAFNNPLTGIALHKIVTDNNKKPVDYIFLEVNDTFEKFTGLKRDDIINRRVTEVLPLQDVAELIQIYGKVALTGESTSFETFVPTLNRFYEIEAFSSHRGEFTVVFSNITPRKKAEEKIQRLANVVESSSDAILTKSLEGTIISWNKGAEQVYGYSGEEVLGMHISILEPSKINGETEKLINEIKNGRNIDNYETIRLKKDNELINVSINLSPVFDTSGELVAISSIVRDITEYKLAEAQKQKLLEQTQLFAEELEVSNEELRITTEELQVANEDMSAKTEDLQISNERFKLLSAAARTILSSETPERIVETICKKVMDYLDCDVFFNYLLNEKEQRLHLNAYSGVPEETRKSIEWLDLGIAVCGCVARDNNRIIAENVQETSDERTELVKSFGIKAYACHPIISNERTIGTLSFGTKSRSHFAENELELMRTVTNYVATAMERKIREEEVTRARDDWESTFDAVPDLIVLLDHEHKVIRANDAMAAKLGVTPEECIGLPCYRAVHGTDEPPSFCPHSKLLEDGCEHTTEVHEENLGGNFIVSVAPLHSSDKKLMGSVHVAHDITKRKEAENTILKAKEQTELDRKRLETILETTPSAVIIVEASDGRISYINRRAKQIYGIDISGSDLASVITKVKSRMVDGSKYPVGEGPSSRALKGETVLNEEMIIEQPDGTTIPIMGSTAPIFDSEGKVTAAVAIFEDITDRKKAEKEREITVEFLRIVNESTRTHDLIQSVTTFFQQQSGCEAVGIRLHEGEDYPYYEARGFPKEFILLENELCARNKDGEIIRDDKSNPIMECMCGNVICGRFDPAQEFFTANGSFWTNCTTELLASTSEDDRQARTRNRCNGEGYESVALIPLHIGKQQLGLLQLNDRKKGIFSPEIIALWERLADYLSVALAKYKAEEALQVSEKKYRGIIENIQDGYFRLDKEGKIIMASPSLAEMYGFGSSQEMIGITAAPLYKNIEDREQMMGELNKQGKLDDYEIEAVRGNDSFWASVNAQYYYDNQGQIQGIEGFTRDVTLRKKAENALKESEERYYNLFKDNHAVMLLIDPPTGKIIDSNSAADSFYGYTHEEMLKMNINDINILEDKNVFSQMQKAQSRDKRHFIFKHRLSNGEIRDVSVYSGPLNFGNKVLLYSIIHDITEQKMAEEALKESEEKFSKAFNDNPAAMTLSDDEGRWLDVNESFVKLTGYNRDELVGRTSAELNLINTEKRKLIINELQDKGTMNDSEFEIQTKSGAKRIILSKNEKIQFRSEIRFLTFIYDITERKKAEKALIEGEERYRSIIENIQDAYFRGDNEGKIVMASNSAAKMYGYDSPEEIIGLSVLSMYQNDKERNYVLEELNKHGKITDNEIEGVKKDGSLFWVSQNAQYYYDDNGEIQGTEAFVRDITERKKLEMERQQLAQQRQLALDAAKMGWWHYDPITEISTYDKQYKEIFGVSGSKRPNDEILKILHPDDLPGVWAKVEEALDPENPKHYFAEYRIFRDGEVRWIEAHGIATFEGEGNKKHAKSLIGTVTDVTERRNAEKSIQRSETQFKVLTNNLRSGVALIDETGKFKIVNPAFMELFNLDNELDILNVNNQDWDLWKVYAENGSLLHVDDHPIRKVAITGKPVRNQLVGVQNPGAKKLKWMLVSAEPMLNKDGSSMTICTYYDITQLKEAETELQTSHERFDRVLNKLTDLFAIADSKWRYLYVNDAYVQFVGKPREQLLGQVIWDIIPEAVGTINYENFMKTAEDGIKRTWVSHSPIGDRWMEYGAFSWDEGVAILTRDITERKLAEEEIQRNLKLLNSINKVFSESLTCKTVEEVVTKSLEVAEDLTGSEFGFIGEINSNGRLDDRAISPPGWDACTANPEKSLELLSNMEIVSYWGRTIKEGKSQIVNDPESDPDRRGLPEGHPPIRSFLGVPLKQGGKIIGMISLANKEGGYTDEDKENIEILSYAFVEALMRKRAEIELKISNEELEFSNKELEIYSNQLKSANDELESFAYSVSHDLRTPLRAIDGYSQVLLRRYGDKLDENGKRFLNNVRDNTEMMSNLINDILALSRAGRIEIEKSDVDMESLVNNIMEELKPTTVGRNIQFKIDHLPNAHSDRTVMRQILTNLLSNSIKFTEPKKTAIIEVGAEEKMDDITYYVKDNGVGFDMNYIHKLFDLFQRLHSQKEFEGTGVGLAIVKRLIDRQGGHIWAEGIVNEGATFYFKLPKHSFCSPKISDFRRLPKKSLKEDL